MSQKSTFGYRPKLVLASLLVSVSLVEGFANQVQRSPFGRLENGLPFDRRPSRLCLESTRSSKAVERFTSPLATSTMALPVFLASTVPLAGSLEAPSTAFAAFIAVLPAIDPSVEAEVLNDMAHVALDLTTFFGPTKILIRCFMVIGRLFAMGADYLPDHSMHPEELVFQLFMLCVAWCGLLKAALPMALATFASKISLRDGKSYNSLFEPAGMTWSQYKAMSAFALDWIEVGPGEIITSDEDAKEDQYFYWLYCGDATVESNGNLLYTVERPKSSGFIAGCSDDAGLGLFGETRLLRLMDASKRNNNKLKKSSSKKAYLRTTVEAGPSGATLMRVKISNLNRLMAFDQDLAQTIRNLLFQTMQDKLAAQCQSL
ncbi:predicted protein [Phaeodactylum tricornutum CCAP 1055/1]|jgi:hypothetical protein|uniref:Cyclic nucleotide-binding domain-containing protein n=1 Tax=Phaeodactylum tricornutum (strain CCAP 1055/1) TaxID=556484 RepID=B7G9S3_PHATC|nr:predicted protein [Phaeodactylum tricornutum CCAP 1055/1]EEC44496.1 predicted protein [Phaeodactylum tricornutum CCAP 1055/1]|eukprot:XP_002183827.1 predicted protein [Phaeodactylum tricornutum CCAP 1055/1]